MLQALNLGKTKLDKCYTILFLEVSVYRRAAPELG